MLSFPDQTRWGVHNYDLSVALVVESWSTGFHHRNRSNGAQILWNWNWKISIFGSILHQWRSMREDLFNIFEILKVDYFIPLIFFSFRGVHVSCAFIPCTISIVHSMSIRLHRFFFIPTKYKQNVKAAKKTRCPNIFALELCTEWTHCISMI